MIFIETPIFTEDLKGHLEDEEYRKLQEYLAEHPEAGDLIEETGGLRKIRGAAKVVYGSFTTTSPRQFRYECCLSTARVSKIP